VWEKEEITDPRHPSFSLRLLPARIPASSVLRSRASWRTSLSPAKRDLRSVLLSRSPYCKHSVREKCGFSRAASPSPRRRALTSEPSRLSKEEARTKSRLRLSTC
jgi:hypothetical protein